eukprot:TRINITY_DN8869_c0_g1_i2.p1 TRINITY_DN8869_c0_g1~~TRINITY_DN8869_c0_g1_i2.p1  ORF type:complete len:168 (-),score=45.37 TRINITY_DN8869_c0_g1_i2:237-680(-)
MCIRDRSTWGRNFDDMLGNAFYKRSRQIFRLTNKYARQFSLTERSRFFILTYKYNDDASIKQASFISDHLRHVETHESDGTLLLAANNKDFTTNNMIFKCKDETVPYHFVKKDPFYKNGLVNEYNIEEIEMVDREDAKALAKLHPFR